MRAPDEKTARKRAQSAFRVETRFKHHPRLIAPWARAELVHASRIEDQRFDPDGPSGLLVPSFDADIARHPKKPVPVESQGGMRAPHQRHPARMLHS